MNKLEKSIIQDLVFFYTLCIVDRYNHELKKLAMNIHDKYTSAIGVLLDDELGVQLSKLVDYFMETGIPYYTKDEIVELLKQLNKKLKEN